MNTASGFDLFLRSIASGGREFIFEILPWIAVWLLVASPFAWLLARFKQTKMGRNGLIVWVTTFTLIIAGACAVIHGVLAFGEAFVSVIDRNRVRVFVALTVIFPFIAVWYVSRDSKNEEA